MMRHSTENSPVLSIELEESVSLAGLNGVCRRRHRGLGAWGITGGCGSRWQEIWPELGGEIRVRERESRATMRPGDRSPSEPQQAPPSSG